MAVWTEADRGPDRCYFGGSFVTKFRRRAVLENAVTAMVQLGYRVTRLDAASWKTPEDLHDGISRVLDFPDYYGRNFDALNDCLSDVAAQSYGWSPEDTGLILVIDNIDKFWAAEREAAFVLLDVFSLNAQGAALFGNRLACLVRSDDAWFEPMPIGASSALWNRAEWLNSNRTGDL